MPSYLQSHHAEFAFGWTTRVQHLSDAQPLQSSITPVVQVEGPAQQWLLILEQLAWVVTHAARYESLPHNNLVGLRGTQGLSSRAGIIPLSSSRDIGGPLARNTRDLAVMLDATVGYDPRSPDGGVFRKNTDKLSGRARSPGS